MPSQTIELTLPTLHAGQIEAFDYVNTHRFSALRCGRRWGKTTFATVLACDRILKGQSVGVFAPIYKFISEQWDEITTILAPAAKSSNKTVGKFRAITGGELDVWTLDNENAGRGRKYDLVILDELGAGKDNVVDIWKRAIRPTLVDRRGAALGLGTPNGISKRNFLWQICNEPSLGFAAFHAPTSGNPGISADELHDLEFGNDDKVWRQEYLAEFVDWSGNGFFNVEKLLLDGRAVPWPTKCDAVFAIMDTAVKTGRKNDGTGVTYFAIQKYGAQPYQLVILDWDIVQIEGALLETWLPTVTANLEAMSRETKARAGSLGVFIEDSPAGAVLIQQAARRGLNARKIEGALTSVGKDERAISVSGYVHRELVKISERAHDRVTVYKGISSNHFLDQVCGFQIGVADQADDLLDTFTYGISIALGDARGN